MGMGLPSLMGTLAGLNNRNPEEPDDEEIKALLAQTLQRAQGLQGQAQQAGTEYQQAAQAPPPDLGGAAFFPTLLSHIASTIAQDPSFKQRAQDQMNAQRAQLLKARSDNLLALREKYQEQAQAAREAGNSAQQLEANLAIQRNLREHEKVMEAQKQGFEAEQNLLTRQAQTERDTKQDQARLAEIREQGRQQRLTDAAKPTTSALVDPAGLANVATSVESGQTKITDYPIKERRAIVDFMKANNMTITPPKAREAIAEVGSAEKVVDELANISAQINTAKAGFLERGFQGGKNLIDAVRQTSVAADLEVVRGGFAGNLARAVSAERGVLTDQDRAFAMRLVPSLFDSADQAARKITRLREFLQAKKERAVKAYSKAPDAVMPGSSSTNGGGTVRMKDRAGKFYQIPADKVKSAIADGLTRAGG